MIVYTVIFDDYDVLLPPTTQSQGVRYVCVTDRVPPNPEGWEIRLVELPSTGHPYAQRWHKILSHLVFPDEEVTLYLDGNLHLQVEPRALVESYLTEADIALFEHPERSGVYAELEACARLGKDQPHILENVAVRYRREGMPEDGYLHAAGLILRRHTEAVIGLNELWMEELLKTSIRDQPSLAFTLWKTGVRPSTIAYNIWRNNLVAYSPHKPRQLAEGRRYLFLCGNPRSGTTALCDLLNVDERIIIGMERYRRVREEVRPEHFTQQRFFDPTPKETTFLPKRLIPSDQPGFTVWPEDEEALKRKWVSTDVVYLGDKSSFYIRQLPYLRGMFPSARFVVALRDPVSVADSYQRRAENIEDHWPAENDYTVALEHWNQSVADVLAYLEEFGLSDLFLVDYDSFFSGDVDYLRSLYDFLRLNPDEVLEARFEEMTRDWGTRFARTKFLSQAMETEVRDGADWDGYWALKRLASLMRDYRLLSRERRLRDQNSRETQTDKAHHQQVVELARTLYSDLRSSQWSRSEDIDTVDEMWRLFWSLDRPLDGHPAP